MILPYVEKRRIKKTEKAIWKSSGNIKVRAQKEEENRFINPNKGFWIEKYRSYCLHNCCDCTMKRNATQVSAGKSAQNKSIIYKNEIA